MGTWRSLQRANGIRSSAERRSAEVADELTAREQLGRVAGRTSFGEAPVQTLPISGASAKPVSLRLGLTTQQFTSFTTVYNRVMR